MTNFLSLKKMGKERFTFIKKKIYIFSLTVYLMFQYVWKWSVVSIDQVGRVDWIDYTLRKLNQGDLILHIGTAFCFSSTLSVDLN